MRQLLAPRFVITMLLLSGTLLASVWSERRKADRLALPLQKIDTGILGWHSLQDGQLDPGVLRKLDPTSYLSRRYRKGSTDLDLFIAYYAQQRAGEAMHSPKHCLPGAGWEIWKLGSAIVPVHGGQVRVNKYSIANSGQRMLMFYWYQGKEQRVIASEYMVKLLLLKDSVFTGHTAGSIVRITLPDTPEAAEEGVAFAARLIEQVEHCFGQ
jgi:EpsI family protein